MSRPNLKRTQTTTQVAESFEVDPKTVRGWIKDGCPATKPGKPGKPWMLDETEVAAWLKSEGRTGQPGRPAGAGSEDLDGARLRKELAMAENWEQRNAVMRGDLIDRSESDGRLIARARALRSRFLSIPDNIASQCEHRPAHEIRDIMLSELTAALEHYAAKDAG